MVNPARPAIAIAKDHAAAVDARKIERFLAVYADEVHVFDA